PHGSRLIEKTKWFYLLLLGSIGLVSFLPTYSRWAGFLIAVTETTYLIPAYLWTAILVKSENQEVLPREKLRFRYAAWGLVIVIALHLTDTLYFADLSNIVPLGTLARSVYLIFLFQLFIQRELLTAQELLSRVFLFGSISLVLSGIYWLLVSWVGSRPGLFLFNTVVASFAILVLFEPLKSAVSRLMNKLFLRRNVQLESELNILAEDLRGIADPRELSQKIALSLKKVLSIDRAVLFLLEKDGLSYVRADGRLEEACFELSSASPLVEYMTLRRGRPFMGDSIRTDLQSFHSVQGRKFLEDCLEALRHLGADLVVPFFYTDKVIGFVAAPLSERIILSTDLLRLFMPVSRQIALLLKSAQALTISRDREKLATIGEMAAGLAHEIKNPLGAIKGAAELLSNEKNQETVDEYLKIIQDEANRLSGVLTQFLDFAKPRKQDPESVCNPLKVIEHTAALCLPGSKVGFLVHADKGDIQAEVDPEILKQVLLNLFLNATQAMEGQPNAALTVLVKEIKPRPRWAWGIPLFKTMEGWEKVKEQPDKPFVEIEVQDNGPGISPGDRNKIFTPFFTTKAKGTGLGLAICMRLMESVGGTIQVRPNTPKGTRVILHLPAFSKTTKAQTAGFSHLSPQGAV
ncbi:MAG: ATP-binding protein, partial [Pseudomonadota bacterium]